ncbi:MAG TPA: class I SAM-dependent methyltransferase [Candidatus Dormibacteraeota bacterium]|nr:class I SAM-dependent methyltransferase [Candidatus Dormibacteraeota bacterium]
MTSLDDDIGSVNWYHTMELAPGLVTPGLFDLRHLPSSMPFPASMRGMRCLDIATADGFWAFEMERRGAAEVLAIDLEDPLDEDYPGDLERTPRADLGRNRRTFEVARRALGSRVERRSMSVYDLRPEATGVFDFVFIGNLLIHLRDPVLALAAARTVTRGTLLSFEVVSLGMTILHRRVPAAHLGRIDRVLWWTPNVAAHNRFLEAAGFRVTASGGPLAQRWGRGFVRLPLRERLRTPWEAAKHEAFYRLGIPSHWSLGTPDPSASLRPSASG